MRFLARPCGVGGPVSGGEVEHPGVGRVFELVLDVSRGSLADAAREVEVAPRGGHVRDLFHAGSLLGRAADVLEHGVDRFAEPSDDGGELELAHDEPRLFGGHDPALQKRALPLDRAHGRREEPQRSRVQVAPALCQPYSILHILVLFLLLLLLPAKQAPALCVHSSAFEEEIRGSFEESDSLDCGAGRRAVFEARDLRAPTVRRRRRERARAEFR